MTAPMIQPMMARRGKRRHLASAHDLCTECGVCYSLCGKPMDYPRTERARILDKWLPDCETCAKALAL